jgi:transcriptional regulator with PAS, ATPase and Fis domain
VQAKLLRVLQDRIVERIGGDRAREVDFRLVSATNRDLETLVAENAFRLDLYYRISPIVIVVPPLRERREDIGLLAAHFLKDVAERHARPEPELTDAVIAYWMEQSWPGNARQLRHEVERAFVFAESGRITVDTVSRGKSAGREAPPVVLPGHTLRDATLRTEADLVREAMVRLKGNNTDYAIRFHLHPAIKASRLSDARGVMLVLPNRDVWIFEALDDKVSLEDSVFLAGNDGPRRTAQIVIHQDARQTGSVRWSFARSNSSPSQTSARRSARNEPELPL